MVETIICHLEIDVLIILTIFIFNINYFKIGSSIYFITPKEECLENFFTHPPKTSTVQANGLLRMTVLRPTLSFKSPTPLTNPLKLDPTHPWKKQLFLVWSKPSGQSTRLLLIWTKKEIWMTKPSGKWGVSTHSLLISLGKEARSTAHSIRKTLPLTYPKTNQIEVQFMI